MLLRTLKAAAVAALFLTAVSGAQAAPAAPQSLAQGSRSTVNITAARIGHLRDLTWGCQKRADLGPSTASLGLRDLAAVPGGYRAWVAQLWQHRLDSCRVVLARTLPSTGDWQTAVNVAQRVYPGSAWWLLDCSGSEGGHGLFVYHGGRAASAYEIAHEVVINTPGGWMQYFHGTFVSDFNAAVQDLRARGVRVPRSAFSWYSALGQALAGGWAYGHDRPPGKWTGSGC